MIFVQYSDKNPKPARLKTSWNILFLFKIFFIMLNLKVSLILWHTYVSLLTFFEDQASNSKLEFLP